MKNRNNTANTKVDRDRRIVANYEFHKKKFEGKTDQEVQELVTNCFDTSIREGINLSDHTTTALTSIAFAGEEELRRRRESRSHEE